MSLNSLPCEEHQDDKSISDLDIDVNQALLVEALKKDKKEIDDLTRIYDVVCGLKFFKSLFAETDPLQRNEVLMKLCSKIKYERIPMGKFVFRQDDPSNNKFYVILSGEVGIITNKNYSDLYARDKEVYEKTVRLTSALRGSSRNTLSCVSSLSQLDASTKHELDEIDENRFKYSDKKSPSIVRRRDSKGASLTALAKLTNYMGTSIIPKDKFKEIMNNTSLKSGEKQKKDDGHESEDDEEKAKEKVDNSEFKKFASRYGFLVRILSKGAEFGDAALKEPGKKRSASILCKTNCEFLVINSQTYNDFIRRKSDLKSEFLVKSFPFLASVSSSQMRNKILYSFTSGSFSQGQLLTNEGVIVKKPKLYLIESGECKIQKKYVVTVRNPCRPDEILQEKTHWLTLCTVGPGTLLGEEVLEYTRPHEHYDYRVIVSKSFRTLVNIHTELEDQIRSYYQMKKKQRNEIYQQMVSELESKGKHVQQTEKFLRKHVNMAHAINKATMGTFNRRLLRESSTSTKENVQSNTSLPQSSLSPICSTPSLPERINHKKHQAKTFRISTCQSNNELPKDEALFENAILEDDTFSQDYNDESKQERISVMEIGENPTNTAKKRFSQQKDEIEDLSKNGTVFPSHYRLSLSPKCKRFKQSKATAILGNKQEVVGQTTREKSIKEELISMTEKEKSHKRSLTLCPGPHQQQQQQKTRFRIRVASQVEEKFEKIRDTQQEHHQMNYLSNLPEKAPDSYRADKMKFVFTQDKESHIRTFNKEKQLRRGGINESKSMNYLTHKGDFGTSIKLRLAQIRPLKESKDMLLVSNINYLKPTPEHQAATWFRPNPLISSGTPNEDYFNKTGFSLAGSKQSNDQSKSSFKFITQDEKPSLKCEGKQLQADDIFNTTLDYGIKESLPVISVEPTTSRIHVSQSTLSDRESNNEAKKTSPIYQTLLMKSMIHKQLHRKGLSLSTNRSFSQNSTADNLLDTALSFNSNKMTLDNRSPMAY